MHLTESSDLLTPENVARLLKSWDPYWDKSKRIYVEKTPANLLMTRFLQAAFPNSCFIVIRRHPVPASMATQKWKINVTSLYNLFGHWLHCHSLFEEDRKYLKHVYELKYEDYIQDAERYHREIAAFIGTHVPEPPKEDKFRTVAQWRNPSGLRVPERTMEEPTGAHNKKYFDRWSYLLTNSPFKSYYRFIARKYESSFAVYGYSLREGFGLSEKVQRDISRGSNAFGTLFCIGADVYAAISRAYIRAKKSLRLTIKAILPEFALRKIRNARQSAYHRNEPPRRCRSLESLRTHNDIQG
jgi:hypothetical protein